MRRCLAAIAALISAFALSVTTDAQNNAPDPTGAFEHAYGASFYYFDACGDGLSGRIYRQALVDKLMHCPFTDEAKAHFRIRSAMQRGKANEMIRNLIDQAGGLPVRLEGMTRTCHEQMESQEYLVVRSRLEAYSAGKAARDDVVPSPCDAAQITP